MGSIELSKVAEVVVLVALAMLIMAQRDIDGGQLVNGSHGLAVVVLSLMCAALVKIVRL